MSVGQKVARNSLATAISQVGSIAIVFFLTPLILKSLATERYGLFVLISSFSVTSGTLSIAALGIPTALSKYVAQHIAERDYDSVNQVISSAFHILSAFGIMWASILLFSGRFLFTRVFDVTPGLMESAMSSIYFLCLQIVFEFPSLAFQSALEGLQRFGILRAITSSAAIIIAVATVAVLYFGMGVPGLVALNAMRALMVLILGLIGARTALPTIRIKRAYTSLAEIRRLVRFGVQTLGFRVTGIAYKQGDQYILGSLLTVGAVGQYSIAVKIQRFVSQFLGFISSVVMPAASELEGRNDKEGLRKLFLRATRYNVSISLGVGIPAMFMAGPIIEHWLGSEYLYLTPLSRLALIYVLLIPFSGIGFSMLIGMGTIKPLLIVNVAATVANIALSIFLTLKIGLQGIIIATLVAYGVAVFAYLWVSLSSLGVSWGSFATQVILKILPSASALCASLFILTSIIEFSSLFDVLLVAAFSGAIYVLFWIPTALSPTERSAILASLPLIARSPNEFRS